MLYLNKFVSGKGEYVTPIKQAKDFETRNDIIRNPPNVDRVSSIIESNESGQILILASNKHGKNFNLFCK